MDLKNFKAKGSIGMGAVYARLQENQDRAFVMAFVRASEGKNEPKGSVCVRTVRYGAPAVMSDGRKVMGDGRKSASSGRKVVRHDMAGTIPFHYEGTSEYRSILVSHILVFDGYLVSL